MAGSSSSQGSSQSTSYSQSTSDTYIPDYLESPMLREFAQHARDMSDQVYSWGMDQFNKGQGDIDGLMRDALSYASPQRIAVDMGMAEAGVQQAAERGRQSAIRDLESYGIDPSSGRYAALDSANRVMSAAAAAGAGNQQRMADQAAGNAMRNQAIAAGLQNRQFGLGVGDSANRFLGTAMQLKYPPLGKRSQSTSESQSTSQHSSQSEQTDKPTEPKPPPADKGGGTGKQPAAPKPAPKKDPEPASAPGPKPTGGPKAPGPKPTGGPKAPQAPPKPEDKPLGPEPEPTGPQDLPKPLGPEPEPTGPQDLPDPNLLGTPNPNLPPLPTGDDVPQRLEPTTGVEPLPLPDPNLPPLPEGPPLDFLPQPDPNLPPLPEGEPLMAGDDRTYGPDVQLPGQYAGEGVPQTGYDPYAAGQPGTDAFTQPTGYDPVTGLAPGDEGTAADPVGSLYGMGPQGDWATFDYGISPLDYQGDPNAIADNTYGGAMPAQPDDMTAYAPDTGPSEYSPDWTDNAGYDDGLADPGLDPNWTDNAGYDDGLTDPGNYYEDPGYDETDYGDTNFDEGDYYEDPGYNEDDYEYTDDSDTGDDSYTDYTEDDTGDDAYTNYTEDESGDDYTEDNYSSDDSGDDYSADDGGYSGDDGGYSDDGGDYSDSGGDEGRRGGLVRRGRMRRGKRRARIMPPGRPRSTRRPMRTGFARGGGVPPPGALRKVPPPPFNRFAQPQSAPRPARGAPMMAPGGPRPGPAPRGPQMPGNFISPNGMPPPAQGGMMAPQRMAGGGQAGRRAEPTTGGFVSREMSPSAGSRTDDVQARLNAGEFVIPQDVASFKGKEFFYNLIAKARRMRSTSPGSSNGGGTGYGTN